MKITRGTQERAWPLSIRGCAGNLRYPCIGDIKLDGEYVNIVQKDGRIWAVNKYGTVYSDHHELQKIQRAIGPTDMCLMAELHVLAGRRGDLYDLLSEKASEDEHLKFSCFDILICNGINLVHLDLMDRRELLIQMLPKEMIITSEFVPDYSEATKFYNLCVAAGYEGVVLKNCDGDVRSMNSWVKIKAKDQNDYVVSLIDPIKERMEVIVPTPQAGTLAPKLNFVGVKLCNKYKSQVKEGDVVTIEHQGILDTGGLRHPVFIRKAVN